MLYSLLQDIGRTAVPKQFRRLRSAVVRLCRAGATPDLNMHAAPNTRWMEDQCSKAPPDMQRMLYDTKGCIVSRVRAAASCSTISSTARVHKVARPIRNSSHAWAASALNAFYFLLRHITEGLQHRHKAFPA